MENNVTPSKLSSALADVRKAYRVLVPFHEMMKNTLLYINEQCRFYDKDTDIKLYPFGAFADRVIEIDPYNYNIAIADELEVKFNDKTYYKNINLVGYSIVRFGGPSVFDHELYHNQVAELLGFIVPDDRLIMSRLRDVNNILNTQDAENASGYIVLFAAINNNYMTDEFYDVGDYIDDLLWLAENDGFSGLDMIRELLSSPSDEKIISNIFGDKTSILKRYRLEDFADKQSKDRVLRDFAELVLDESGIKLFNDQFY